MNYQKYSRPVIIAILTLTALSFIPLTGLKFDFDIEQFFPVNDPDLDYFTEFQGRFYTQVDDEFIFIALKNEAGIFDQGFLKKVDSLTRFVTSLENILMVYSVTNIPSVSIVDGKLEREPMIHIDRPDLYKADSIKLFASGEYGLMFSGDRKSVAITALNATGLSDAEKDHILEGLEEQIGLLGFDRYHIAAKIKLERTYIKEIQKNLSLYLGLSFLLIAIVLSMMYRSVIGVVVPLITVVVAICWTLALISLVNYPLDVISSLLPPVLAVICMSDIIHISTKYIDESRKDISRSEALQNTFREIGTATFFTSVTTAAGFYSLCVSNVIPIRSFGFFAGTGVLLAFFIAMGTMLAVYASRPIPKIVRMIHLGDRWQYLLARSHDALTARKNLILALAALLLIPSAYFISRIEINSSLLQELPQDHAIIDDYAFIEDEFSGTRSFEMALILKDTTDSFLDLETLGEIEVLERFLKDSIGIGNLFSPVTFIKGGFKALSGGDQANYRLPDHQADIYTSFDQLFLSPVGKDMIRFITQDAKYARIGGKLPNLTIKEFEALSTRIDEHFGPMTEAFSFDYKLTGSALLIDKVSYSLVRNLFTGLAIGLCVISLIVTLMFRSLKMVVIVLVANVIPLVIMAGVMGAMGIFLKADTAIVFAISFGIVVDDSIHFINRFRLESAKGKSVAEAVKDTYLTTGKAMIITTIILLAGFISLTFSSFGGTYYIGLLVSLCLAVALIIDLTVLPALILVLYKPKSVD